MKSAGCFRVNWVYILLSGKVKDPFPPARIAAINAIAATQQFYTLAETSGKVVPMLCTLMSDPEKPVREQAFKVSFTIIFSDKYDTLLAFLPHPEICQLFAKFLQFPFSSLKVLNPVISPRCPSTFWSSN